MKCSKMIFDTKEECTIQNIKYRITYCYFSFYFKTEKREVIKPIKRTTCYNDQPATSEDTQQETSIKLNLFSSIWFHTQH